MPRRTVVQLDLAGFSDIARRMEADFGDPDAVKKLQEALALYWPDA